MNELKLKIGNRYWAFEEVPVVLYGFGRGADVELISVPMGCKFSCNRNYLTKREK